MKTCSRIAAFFVIVAAIGCAKVDTAAPAGNGSGNTNGSGGSIGGTGSGGSPGTAGRGATGSGGEMRGTSGGGMGGEASCGLQNFDLVRRPSEILVVLDRSASMKDNAMDVETAVMADWKWSHLIPALTEVVRSAPDILWGLKVFPESPDGKECVPHSVSAKIDLPIAEMSSTAVANHIMSNVTPEGDGTPTGPAVMAATDYLKTRTTDNRKYILLATDGQPSCAGRPGTLTGGNSAAARIDAIAAVTAAAAAGYHTFVVGVATTKTNDRTTLNMLATAGLEGRTDPNPLADKFYLATTRTELVNAFKVITGAVSTCLFPLSKVPPVPNNIAVKVMGTKAPFDPSATNGWNYTDGTNTAVEVYGSWCEMVKSTAANNMVQIIFGCPDIPIP